MQSSTKNWKQECRICDTTLKDKLIENALELSSTNTKKQALQIQKKKRLGWRRPNGRVISLACRKLLSMGDIRLWNSLRWEDIKILLPVTFTLNLRIYSLQDAAAFTKSWTCSSLLLP